MTRIEVTRVDQAVAWMCRAQRRPGGRLLRLALVLVGVDFAGRAGPGLRMPHATTGSVVHPDATLGDNVTMWHGVTLGRADVWKPADPTTSITIGDDVILGANSVILVKAGQQLTVGHGAVIGAGAVVTTDVPAGEVWAGNPARRVSVR